MQHILFKIKSMHYTWSNGKIYEQSGFSKQCQNLHGYHTVKLTAEDLREMADLMDRIGLKNIRFVKDRNGFYIALNE